MKTNLLEIDRRSVREAFQKTDLDAQDCISSIRLWFRSQMHLPEIPCDEIIEYFLVTNKFSIERTKEKMDMYYTIKNLLPDVFLENHPKLPQMKKIAECVWILPTPKLTKELYRVIILKISGDPSDFNAYKFFGHQSNMNEIRLYEDSNLGDLLIVDLKDVKRGHVVKFTLTHMKTAALILEKVWSNRIKSIHLINAPPYADVVITLVKTVMKEKLASRIYVHNSVDDLSKHISKDVLPSNYGGEEIPLEEIQGLWLKKLEEYEERFDKLESMRVKENLRPVPLKNDDILGYHGNFRKLEVD